MLTLTSTPLQGLYVAVSERKQDERGHFMRAFCEEALQSIVHGRRIVQANLSMTRMPGTVRGMHFQHPPHAEMKLVRCVRGRVFDVAVDLRAGSPTFFGWYGIELSPDSANMMVIPEGFAHGFQALEEESELLYLHTAEYVPASEGAVRFDEPRMGIVWPQPPIGLSERDHNIPLLTQDWMGIPV